MKETFGQKITRLRKAKGLTQEDIAKNITISPQAVSKWENDISTPDIYITKKLADILGVSVDDLIDEDKEVTPSGEVKDHKDELPAGITIDEDGDVDIDEDIVYKDDKHYQKWSKLTTILEPICVGVGLLSYITMALMIQVFTGSLFGWVFGWTFILYGLSIGSIFLAIKDRKVTSFLFPVFIVATYCLIGFMGLHYDFPGFGLYWFLFLLIPFFYIIFGRIDKYNEDKRLNIKK